MEQEGFCPLLESRIERELFNWCKIADWTAHLLFLMITWNVAAMSNQELVQTGRKQMDDTDQTIERSKKVCEPLSTFALAKVFLLGRSICWSEYQNFAVEFFLGFALKNLPTFKESSACHRKHFHWCVFYQVVEDTINIGAETASTLKGQVWDPSNLLLIDIQPTTLQYFYLSSRVVDSGVLIWWILLFMKCPWLSWLALQTDQLGRITNELDTIQFSIKKASQLVKEIGRQVCYLSGWFYNLGVFPFLDCNSGMQLRSVSSLRGAMRHTCPTIYLESHWYKSRQFSYSLHIG